MKGPEAVVKDEIKKYLKTVPGIYQFWPVQTGYGVRTLDCLGSYRGKFFGIEVKRADKPAKPEPRQATIMEDIARAGGGVLCTNSVDEVRDFIARL